MPDINGIPYVESTDLVSAYPAVSLALAQELDDQLASKVDYALTANAQSGTGVSAYTFALADASRLTTATGTSAKTFTIPPQTSVTWVANSIIRVANYGAGDLTIAGGSGVTVTNASKTLAQYESAALVRTGSNAWTLIPFSGGAGNADFSNAATGTYSDSGINYKYITYTASGTLTVTKAGFADVLVVGGGGGGGKFYGGGAGAGGHFYRENVYLTATTHTITVGGGGAGSSSDQLPGRQGAPSSIGGYGIGANGLIGYGGGGGGAGGASTGSITIQNGGCGGGSGDTTISGTGYQGGNGANNGLLNGGGGGGAGANGSGRTGGAGTANSITGSSVTRAGGGGGWSDGAGGSGGGGAAGGNNGTANTGGGGGAATSGNGGTGGSGVVVVRVRT